MIRFATPRLEIRDAEPADFPALLSLYTHKEVIRYAFGLPGIVNLRARMYAANEASWRLCEKMNMLRIACGNTPEGRAFYEYELKREK